MSADSTPVFASDRVVPRKSRLYKKDGLQVAVFRVKNGTLYVVDNRCPHEGYPLTQGTVDDCTLTCNWHNYTFDLRDGACVMGEEAVAISLTPLELVERLAALIPPPRKNQVLYHGVLAPRSQLRRQVVPGRRRLGLEERSRRSSDLLTRRPSEANPPRWTPWRELLKRSFGVDGFACPMCGQRMMLRAVVMPPATFKVLSGLEAASRAPPRLASLKI
jgi:nitrite reductase/ring-hydroxylating ferredoxin subunit